MPATVGVAALAVVLFAITTASGPLHYTLDPDANPLAESGLAAALMVVGMVAVDRRFNLSRYDATGRSRPSRNGSVTRSTS